MSRVLLLATTTGYQTRAFGEAAERLGVELVFATDRCSVLDDPWMDEAVPIRFFDEIAAVRSILDRHGHVPVDGVLAVGDRPTYIAALVRSPIGLPWHEPRAAETSRNKLLARKHLRRAGVPVPWLVSTAVAAAAAAAGAAIE